jgi:hypothetical protein
VDEELFQEAAFFFQLEVKILNDACGTVQDLHLLPSKKALLVPTIGWKSLNFNGLGQKSNRLELGCPCGSWRFLFKETLLIKGYSQNVDTQLRLTPPPPA